MKEKKQRTEKDKAKKKRDIYQAYAIYTEAMKDCFFINEYFKD